MRFGHAAARGPSRMGWDVVKRVGRQTDSQIVDSRELYVFTGWSFMSPDL